MSLTRSDTPGIYSVSGSSSTSMTSSRLSLEKKIPANALQLYAHGNVELTNLHKGRYQPGCWGCRLGSRSPSHNSRTHHLIQRIERVSTRSGINRSIDLRYRLRFRSHPQKHCRRLLASIAVYKDGPTTHVKVGIPQASW